MDDANQESAPAEAVCFTSGPQGAAFGAGVIHAWLASDRAEPRVVAGISTGAITAAAMQQSFLRREVDPKARTERSRWGWFQSYLTDLLDRPLDVIWKGIPDPVDFFSSTRPVRDLSCPELLRAEERKSRYHFWLLTKLGNWIGSLPITLGELGTAAVLFVRRRERIPVAFLGKDRIAASWRTATFWAQCARIVLQVALAVVLRPFFSRTFEQFEADELGTHSSGLGFRPLFGWKVWLSVLGYLLVGTLLIVGELILLVLGVKSFRIDKFIATAIFAAAMALPVIIEKVLEWRLSPKSFSEQLKRAAQQTKSEGASKNAGLLAAALKAAQIDQHFISNYELKRRIWNRFATATDPNPKIICNSPDRTNLVVVASVLQSVGGTNHQCFAHDGTPLLSALSTACAKQPFFEPTHISGEQELSCWFRKKELEKFRDSNGLITREFDLVDGAVIRKNPLPALFNWLQETENQKVAQDLEKFSKLEKPNIHVIYNVPIEPFDAYEGKQPPDRIDLVEAAEVGILMRARRDTSVEVRQTNFLSSITTELQAAGKRHHKLLSLFAGELAPQRELKFKNPLSPSRDEALTVAAEGCRRTLGRLYESEIFAEIKANGECSCRSFIQKIAPCRASCAPGLPEVCGKCDGSLMPYPLPKRSVPIVHKDFNSNPEPPEDDQEKRSKRAMFHTLPALCQIDKPKITFVASGGVFRGAFHIGLIAAMQAIGIKPDLVVGASVGTLMGAALAAIRNSETAAVQLSILAELTDTFMRVDETVALTVPLKTAVKQLGLRMRRLKLSPAVLKRVVKRGTSADVGYASTGVPPIVIDTLSQLFMIPPSQTLKAGSDFLAGRFTNAAARLVRLIRGHTLDNLDIRYAVIGTSMLQSVANLLLGSKNFNLNQGQPYLSSEKTAGTAIFCTTAYVNQRWPMLLGRDGLRQGKQEFDFIYAALSSSAFPAAFPARREAEVFPGTGLMSNLFCDGGTFDNLPFIPAIEVLSVAQAIHAEQAHEQPSDFLQKRLKAPHLIISGGFDPLARDDQPQRFESRQDISDRSSALAAGVKTESFIEISKIIAKALADLRTLPANPETDRLRTNSVVAGIVNVIPSTELHVNPTFGFARSTGFDPERVAASIADGCFQTLKNLRQKGWPSDSEISRSLKALSIDVINRAVGEKVGDGDCPYFRLRCPFADATQLPDADTVKQKKACGQVYSACCTDPVHRAGHAESAMPASGSNPKARSCQDTAE